MEAKLIGMDDVFPEILWTRYFMECQGHKIEDNSISVKYEYNFIGNEQEDIKLKKEQT